jgi:hypothetical protein
MVRTSIIVPVFDAAPTLERAIGSVLAQTDRDLELILVDDGSTDGSLVLAHGWSDPRMRIIEHGANRGISAARNSGLAAAEGEFVAFLDADDSWERRFLERMHAARGTADAVICGRTIVLADGAERVAHSARLGEMSGAAAAERMMTGEITPFPWDKIIRRTAFAGVEYPEDVRRFEDQVVGVVALSRTDAVVSIPDPLVRYHIAAGSLTWGRMPRLAETESALNHLEASLGAWLDTPRRRAALRVCRTLFVMLTAQSAMRAQDQDAAREVLAGCRRRISIGMLMTTLAHRPVIGAGALLLKIAPALYRRLLMVYVRRQYALG